MATVELKTTILPGGRIEIQNSGLIEGREVTVRIDLEDEATQKRSLMENLAELRKLQGERAAAGERPRRRISEILADYPGGQLFKTADEVDQYIREERDSWGD